MREVFSVRDRGIRLREYSIGPDPQQADGSADEDGHEEQIRSAPLLLFGSFELFVLFHGGRSIFHRHYFSPAL